MEENIKELVVSVKEIKELVENTQKKNSRVGDDRSMVNLANRNITSKRSSMYRSSLNSEISKNRFYTKEINKLKRNVLDKEKEEKKNNIVVGAKSEGDLKE